MNFIPAFYEQMLAYVTTNITEFKYVDIFFDQYNAELANENGNFPFNTPALLIEWRPLDMITLGNRRQATNGQVILHVISEVVQEASSRDLPTIRNKAHAHKDLVDKTHQFFQGWNGNVPSSGFKGFGSFDRQNIDSYSALFFLMIDKITYRTRIVDDIAIKSMVNPNTLTPPIIVDDDIQPEIL